MKDRREHGAVMVEFALIVPLLFLLILAVVEFGFRYKVAATYNNAAFIAARDFSINHDVGKAETAARSAGWPATLPVAINLIPTACTSGKNVTVTLQSSNEPSPTKAFGSTFNVIGKGVSRCEN